MLAAVVQGGAARRTSGVSAKTKHLLRETTVIVSIGIGIFASYLVLSRSFGGFLTGWQFGVLTFLLTTAVVLAIELVTAVADATSEAAEWALRRMSSKSQAASGVAKSHSRQPSPTVTSHEKTSHRGRAVRRSGRRPSRNGRRRRPAGNMPVEQLVGRVRTIEGDETTVKLLRDSHRDTYQTLIVSGVRRHGDGRSPGDRYDRHVAGPAPRRRRLECKLGRTAGSRKTIARSIIDVPHSVPWSHELEPASSCLCAKSGGGILCAPGRPARPVGADAAIRSPEPDRRSRSFFHCGVPVAGGRPKGAGTRLLDNDNKTIASAAVCAARFVSVPLPPGAVHAGDHTTLEVFDDRAVNLRYDIAFVEPQLLPQPPVPLQQDWLVGAWRFAGGAPETRLDGLSRLMTAPPKSLAARWIEDAIFNGEPF